MADPLFDFITSNDLLAQPKRGPGNVQEIRDTSLIGTSVVGDITPDVPKFEPLPESQGFLHDIKTGALDTGIVVGVGEVAVQGASRVFNGIENDHDPEFSLSKSSDADPELLADLEEILKEQTVSRAAAHAAAALTDSRNEGYARYVIQQYKEAKLRKKEVEDSGMFGYILGAGGSILLDVITAAAATKGAAAAPALARGSAALSAQVVSKTQLAARAKAAARIAGLGALEGSTERMVQQAGDINVTDTEIWLAMGLGTGAGAILGGIAPRMLGRQFTRAQIEAAEAANAQMVAARQAGESFDVKGSLSAMETPEGLPSTVGADVPGKGAATLVAKHIIPRHIRNPRNWIRDLGVTGAKRMDDHGLRGALHAWRVGNRVFKSAVNTKGEIDGTTVRLPTLSEKIREMQDGVTLVEEVTRRGYKAMLADVWGQSGLDGGLKNFLRNDQLMKTVVPGAIGRKFTGSAHRIEEFTHHADILAEARADDIRLETPGVELKKAMEAIREQSLQEMNPEQQAKYFKHLDGQSNLDDDFYMAWAERGKAMGLIGQDEPIRRGYRPQMWHVREILENQNVFKGHLHELFGNRPTAQFVNEFFAKEAAEAVTEGVEAETKAITKIIDEEAGETFEQWAKDNPELANEVRKEWAEAADTARQDKLDEAAFVLQEQLDKVQADTFASFKARAEAQATKYVERISKREADLMELPAKDKAGRKELAVQIGKLEKKLGDINARLSLIQEAADDVEAMTRLVRTRGTQAERASLKKAIKQATKSEKKAMQAFVRKSVAEAVDETYDLITNQKSAFGIIPDDLISQSKHFKHRSLDVGDKRNDPSFANFLVRDSAHQRNAYVTNYGRQTAIREIFAPILRRSGDIDDNTPVGDFLKKLEDYSMRGFNDDLVALEKLDVPAKEKAALKKGITKDSKDFREWFQRSFGEITRSDYLNQTGVYGEVIATAQAATAASVLGNVIASLFGDTAITAFAGGRLGTGIGAMFQARKTLKILDEIGSDDIDTMLLLRGANVYDQGLFMSRMDLDSPAFDMPGGKWNTIMKTTQDIATKEGWFNLMHVWNRFVRRGFGVDMARAITDDMMNFDALKPDMKRFYAKHGVGTQEAAELADTLAKHGRRLDADGKIVVPHAKEWADKGLSRELKLYQRLHRSAGDEAMIDPQVGDRPFFRRHAWGRLVLQFQSFTYAAAERFWAPMWQSLRMNPKDARVHTAIVLGMLMATAGEGLRAQRRGELNEWGKEWESGQGRFNILKAAYLRSPFIYGMSGTAIDVLGTEFAPNINEAFQQATGSSFEVADPRYTRFRQQQGIAAFIPAVGLAETMRKAVQAGVEGDTQQMFRMGKARIPFVNALMFHSLAQLMEDME